MFGAALVSLVSILGVPHTRIATPFTIIDDLVITVATLITVGVVHLIIVLGTQSCSCIDHSRSWSVSILHNYNHTARINLKRQM